LAVRLQSWFADEIAVSYDEVLGFFPQAKTWVSGYPVRAEILRAERRTAYEQMGLDPKRKTVLGFGGSRGARAVNQALWAILPELLLDYQVVHVTGQLDWTWICEKRDAMTAQMRGHYHAYPYLHGPELAAVLVASDLVVARAGAATTAEFPAVGLPSILVPYPYSGEHQQLNADFMVEHGAAVCIANADLGERLKPTILRLLADEATLERMSECARSLSRPAASRRLATAVVRLAQRGVVAS
jgi:UDP-N-acetylglucosamine--N-acetylmuramyl-(pentapeptide) pyrophosphoryl-undecaprenol N-acetylglucosamine transferase